MGFPLDWHMWHTPVLPAEKNSLGALEWNPNYLLISTGESTRVQRRWEQKREMKRELRRVKKMCTEMSIVEKRWREVRSRWKSWDVVSQFATRGQKSRKRACKSAAAPIGKPCLWILQYSVTLLKPGNFRHPPCAGSTCILYIFII